MREGILMICGLFLSTLMLGQSPTGTWMTIDDETGEPKSHVKIFEKNGKFYGKVVKLLPSAKHTHCSACKGDLKDAPVLGMQVIWDLIPYKDYWSYGKILDPANGKEYKCSIWLEEDNKLTVRGYIGFSLMGRSQTWYRVE